LPVAGDGADGAAVLGLPGGRPFLLGASARRRRN